MEAERVAKAILELEPVNREIDEAFEDASREYQRLMSLENHIAGKILHCHLITEHYLDRYLIEEKGIEESGVETLRYFQKVSLLPTHGDSASWVRQGLFDLNTIRNKLAHDLEVSLDSAKIDGMRRVLKFSRPNFSEANVSKIVEAFTPIACTFLVPTSAEIREAFTRAVSVLGIAPDDS